MTILHTSKVIRQVLYIHSEWQIEVKDREARNDCRLYIIYYVYLARCSKISENLQYTTYLSERSSFNGNHYPFWLLDHILGLLE